MAAKKSNQLLWTIHGLGVLMWVVCFFFGLAYQTSLIVSIPVSLLLGGFMILFVRGMYKQKTKSTHEPKDSLFDLLYKICYGVISLSSFVFILHFIFITTVERDNIVNDAERQYYELKQIFDETDPNGYVISYIEYRLIDFENTLKTNNIPSGEIKNEIELKTTNFMDDYSLIKEYFTKSSFNKNKDKLNNLVWLDDIQSLLNNLYETKNKCLNDLLESSQKNDFEQHPYKPVSNNYTENLKDRLKFSFEKTDSNSILYSVLLAVIFQFLILLVYFIVQREDKSFKGKKVEGVSSI